MRTSRITACCRLVLIALLLPACSLFEDDDGDVSATAVPPDLIVTNHTGETVWTFVVGARMATVINWAPDVKREGLAPGASERLGYDDLFRMEDDQKMIVYWWRAVQEDGERVPGAIHSFVVEL